MEKDNNYVNDPGDEDQGGRRPNPDAKKNERENETTGYGKGVKPKDEKKTGSGLEEFIEREIEDNENSRNEDNTSKGE
ncbi:MAG: hypothetical protein ACM3S2_09680 [Ignavibacteriales bacterium]